MIDGWRFPPSDQTTKEAPVPASCDENHAEPGLPASSLAATPVMVAAQEVASVTAEALGSSLRAPSPHPAVLVGEVLVPTAGTAGRSWSPDP